MKQYSMTCSCGDAMPPVEAESREEAVTKMRAVMTPEMIVQHMAERHHGEPVPSTEDVHAMIEANVKEVE